MEALQEDASSSVRTLTRAVDLQETRRSSGEERRFGSSPLYEQSLIGIIVPPYYNPY